MWSQTRDQRWLLFTPCSANQRLADKRFCNPQCKRPRGARGGGAPHAAAVLSHFLPGTRLCVKKRPAPQECKWARTKRFRPPRGVNRLTDVIQPSTLGRRGGWGWVCEKSLITHLGSFSRPIKIDLVMDTGSPTNKQSHVLNIVNIYRMVDNLIYLA